MMENKRIAKHLPFLSSPPATWTSSRFTKGPFTRLQSRVYSRTLTKSLDLMRNVRDSRVEKSASLNDFLLFNCVLVNDIYASTPSPDRGMSCLKRASDRLGCRIHAGNLPCGVSSQVLVQFLNRAMHRSKLCPDDCRPVVRCRMSKKFAFVDCTSMEDANKALQLDGVSLLGSKLRVSLPCRYVLRENKRELLRILSIRSTMRRNNATASNNVPSIAENCGRRLVLSNAVSFEDIDEDEDYLETLRDLKDECCQYGPLKKIYVPRCGVHATKVYLEYESVDDAINARNMLKNKMFDERVIDVEYVDAECVVGL
mmetsp:Transcript_29010/g.35318  ORF Transcript_29010/g.35318 Transcript_29010/m.35318 type:complete len:313 (-) Transcript_29010:310-1248(-)